MIPQCNGFTLHAESDASLYGVAFAGMKVTCQAERRQVTAINLIPRPCREIISVQRLLHRNSFQHFDYAWLVRQYALEVMPHHRWSFAAGVHARQIYTEQEIRLEVFPEGYRPDSLLSPRSASTCRQSSASPRET